MEVNAQHELFIEHFLENGGKPAEAALAAGFEASYGYTLFRKLRERIQQRLEDEVFMKQVKALKVVDDSMGDGAVAVKQDVRLRAAESILDRGGLSKKQALDVTGSDLPAVMILPMKEPAPPSAQ